MNISELKGKTIQFIDAKEGEEEVDILTTDGKHYRMSHQQDCCEHVTLNEVIGDLKDLIGNPLLIAEERTSRDNPEGVKVPEYQDSFTWTFYELATIKGSVTLRWYGDSNGYYSESVDFEEIKQ